MENNIHHKARTINLIDTFWGVHVGLGAYCSNLIPDDFLRLARVGVESKLLQPSTSD